jgi:hypothetical protein
MNRNRTKRTRHSLPNSQAAHLPQEPKLATENASSRDDTPLIIAFYNAARAESVQRLALREQTFLAWITTLGVLIGFAVKQAPSTSILEPHLLALTAILCLPFSATIYRHIFITRLIFAYINQELSSALQQKNQLVVHWDASQALRRGLRPYVLMETLVYFIFLAGVPLLVLLYLHFVATARWEEPMMIAGEVCTSLVTVFGLIELSAALRKY